MAGLAKWFTRGVEFIAASMLAAMFATFLIQIFSRYVLLTPFGWTLELCLILWVWIVFFGCAFMVREKDHVTFDIIYNWAGPRLRTWFVVIGAVAIMLGLWASIGPTYDRMRLLWLKSSATLPVKMMPIYSIYFLFLAVVGLRYAWRACDALRRGAPKHDLGRPPEDIIE